MNRTLSIVMPAYNEHGNLERAVRGVMMAAAHANLERWQIIVVDDGSTDGTGLLASGLAAMDLRVQALRHATNRGLRAAYETGLAAARYDYVVWIPGDGEMATESIAGIFRTIGQADLVVPYHGTPERRTWFRRLLTWGSTTQLNWLLGHRLNYFQGTTVYPTELARRLPRGEGGFFFVAEMLAWALEEEPSYVEVPLTHTDRQYGTSKAVSFARIWAAQKLIARLWWRITVARMAAAAERRCARA